MSEFDAFWAARKAHQKQVADALIAVQEVINTRADLYRDGLTTNLMTVQQNIQHLAKALCPPEPEPTPVVEE